MSNLIKITNNISIEEILYKGQRVLTSKQLAEIYNCNERQIRQNFNNNKDKFIEGKHYVKLIGEDLKEFKKDIKTKNLVNKYTPELNLFTLKGCLLQSNFITSINDKNLQSIYKYFGVENNLTIGNSIQRTEYYYLDELRKAFDGIFDITSQLTIGMYRIDYYIQKYNIAIECDENNHNDRDRDYEIQREKFIKKELGCKIIRFDPKFISIGELINKILCAIKEMDNE
jgi:very-short-patch-repair endonuclease